MHQRKNVILNLRDDGVAPDDVGEMCLLQRLQLGSKENSLIPKSIAGAQALELIGDDFSKRRADARAENVILGQATDPKIDRIHISVERKELCLKIRVACDLSETGDTGESVGGACTVIIREAVIASALNVTRSEIKSTRAGRTEKKISKAANEFRIHFLRVVGGEIFQDRIAPN